MWRSKHACIFWGIYFTKAKKNFFPRWVNDRALKEYSKVLHVQFKLLLFLCSPTSYPIREQVTQYDNNSSLELLHYVYISISLKHRFQKFGFVYMNYVNEGKNSDKIVSNKTKTIGDKKTFKPYALNIAYWL